MCDRYNIKYSTLGTAQVSALLSSEVSSSRRFQMYYGKSDLSTRGGVRARYGGLLTNNIMRCA